MGGRVPLPAGAAGPAPAGLVAAPGTGHGTISMGGPGPGGGPPPRPGEWEKPAADTERLVSYLRANRRRERWLLATGSDHQASSLIIDHRMSALALGGFSGADQALDPPGLARLVAKGELRWFLLPSGDGGPGPTGGPFGGGDDLGGAVRRACRAVRDEQWGGPSPSGPPMALYDCHGAADAIRRAPPKGAAS